MGAAVNVYRGVKGIQSAIKDVGRLRHISAILIKHGFGAAVAKMRLGELLSNFSLPKNEEELAHVAHLNWAERLRCAIEEFGTTAIKLGQIVSTRSDLLPPELITELAKLQDNVPPMDWQIVQKEIISALGKPLEELFSTIEQTPIASASIAQVHRATLLTGEVVAVKVRRPNLDNMVRSDLNLIHFIASRAEQMIPELALVKPTAMVKEFDRALMQELNFTHERDNIERFRKNLEGLEKIRIPKTYPQYCSKTILTMEFIEGVKVTEAPKKLNVDPYALAPLMLQAIFQMILVDGFFHGDLHPGNILVQQDGGITLIDFGLAGRLLPRQREDILDLLFAIGSADYEQIARVTFDLGIKMNGVRYDYTAFENDVTQIIDCYVYDKRLGDIDIQGLFTALAKGAINHQIRMPATYTMVFKALMTVDGIGKMLAPNMDLISTLSPFLKEQIAERYNPERLLKEAVETFRSSSRFARKFGRAGPRILRDLEAGQLAIQVESSQWEHSEEWMKRSVNNLLRSIIFGGSVIAGTLALEHTGPAAFGFPVASLIPYTLATLAGLPLLLELLKRS